MKALERFYRVPEGQPEPPVKPGEDEEEVKEEEGGEGKC